MVEVPAMKELAQSMKDRPFSILGVNTDDEDRSVLHKRAREQGLTWPMIYEGSPQTSRIAKQWNVRGYPTLVVIDASGTIRFRGTKLAKARSVVEKLVAELERSRGR